MNLQQCGKVCHPTQKAARIALYDMKKKDGREGRVILRVYRCQVCEAWHLGTMKKRTKKHKRGRKHK